MLGNVRAVRGATETLFPEAFVTAPQDDGGSYCGRPIAAIRPSYFSEDSACHTCKTLEG
jgi:hypothetical protein